MMSHWLRAAGGALASLALLSGLAAARPAAADTLVTAGADKKVKLWNTEDGKLIKEIEAHDSAVNVIALSWNGKILATGGADKKVKLWNPADGKLIKSIDAHDGAVTALWFSTDNEKLYSGSADKKLKVWNTADGKSVATVDAHDGSILGIVTPPQMILTGGSDGMIRIWDETGNKLIEIEHPGMKTMAVNLVEAALYTADKDGAIKWWTQASGNGDFEGSQGAAINAMATMPDGKKLLTGGANGIVKIWDTDSKKMVKEVGEAHKGGVSAIVIAPDGKTIVTSGADKTVKLWSAEGKLLKTVEKAHDGAINGLLYIPAPKAEKAEKSTK
jgi:WD40 repeat protein